MPPAITKISSLFYLFSLLQEVASDAVLEVLLSRFINHPRVTADRSVYCDNNNSLDPCETYFIFCVVEKPFKNPQNCSYGYFQTSIQVMKVDLSKDVECNYQTYE